MKKKKKTEKKFSNSFKDISIVAFQYFSRM